MAEHLHHRQKTTVTKHIPAQNIPVVVVGNVTGGIIYVPVHNQFLHEVMGKPWFTSPISFLRKVVQVDDPG